MLFPFVVTFLHFVRFFLHFIESAIVVRPDWVSIAPIKRGAVVAC